MPVTRLTPLDYVVMATCVAAFLGIGWALRRTVRTSSDFLLAGRSLPSWVTGLAYLAANIGVLEVIAMGAAGARYGIAAAHFFWIGAVPAMLFAGLVMMPVYHASGARTVAEYLGLRFDAKTRALSAVLFSILAVGSAGASMHVMARLLESLLGWSFAAGVILLAALVLAYVLFSGLRGAMYNGVLQLLLLVCGLSTLVFLGLRATGGWELLQHRLTQAAINGMRTQTMYTHAWKGMGDPATNAMGVEGFGLAVGLGFVLSFGYWCTDFRVVQRALAARSLTAARRTPLIAAGVKMLMPFLVIVPGMIALVLGGGEGATAYGGIGQGIIPARRAADGTAMVDAVGRTILDFDMATPMMLVTLFPNGVLGLGVTALIAACMAAMAANLTAFGAVWTYDVYQSRVGEVANDERCLWMGRVAMVGGSVLSVAAAFAASAFDSILEFLQLGVAFVVAPLAATMALGVFWRRATGHGAFAGNLAGMLAAVIHHGISLPRGAAPGIRGGFLMPRLGYPSELAQGFSTAIVAFAACFFVTIIVSFLTRARAEEEMSGLVYALTPKPAEQHLTWAQRPMTLAIAVLAVTVWLNVVFY